MLYDCDNYTDMLISVVSYNIFPYVKWLHNVSSQLTTKIDIMYVTVDNAHGMLHAYIKYSVRVTWLV